MHVLIAEYIKTLTQFTPHEVLLLQESVPCLVADTSFQTKVWGKGEATLQTKIWNAQILIRHLLTLGEFKWRQRFGHSFHDVVAHIRDYCI